MLEKTKTSPARFVGRLKTETTGVFLRLTFNNLALTLSFRYIGGKILLKFIRRDE